MAETPVSASVFTVVSETTETPVSASVFTVVSETTDTVPTTHHKAQ